MVSALLARNYMHCVDNPIAKENVKNVSYSSAVLK